MKSVCPGADLQRIYIILHLIDIAKLRPTLDLTEINPILTDMKKRILLLVSLIAILILAVFAFTNSEVLSSPKPELAKGDTSEVEQSAIENVVGPELPEFVFDLGTRHKSIKKTVLQQATSFNDFIGQEHVNRIVEYYSLSVSELENGKQTDHKISGTSGELTVAQLDFLQSVDYGTDILLWATYLEKWEESGKIEDSYWTPHLTVVPEKQAAYKNGKDALLNYLKVQSEARIIENLEDRPQPGRLHFTVSTDGAIKNTEIRSSSGNTAIDNIMAELIANTSGEWIPAENAQGEKVEQELVLFFGSMGC